MADGLLEHALDAIANAAMDAQLAVEHAEREGTPEARAARDRALAEVERLIAEYVQRRKEGSL